MADEKDDDEDRDEDREGDEPAASGADPSDEKPAEPSSASAAPSDEDDDVDGDGEISPEEQDRIAAREAEAIRREEERLAASGGDHDVVPIAGMLGQERWVQFSFIALAGVVIFLGDRLIEAVWSIWQEPDPTIVSGSAALLGLVVAFVAYRHPQSNEFVREVVGELAKVTWPTRDETYYSTIVVIVTSVIAAVYTGVFDALWSAFTDLVYNV